MNAQVVSKENNTVKFTFQVSPEKFEEGMKYAYEKNKKHISVPGFRKGKVPRKIIEASYGETVFYDDALNYVLETEYPAAVKELDLDVVSKPEIDAKSINKAEGVVFEAEVFVKPEVKLGQYKGLEVEKVDTSVSEETVANELKKVQEQNARLVTIEDRAAMMGDTVTISYKGTIDGVAFEGGESESFDLVLGSHSFIDTFEDQIVGHNVGDAFDVNVTFPEEYHAEDLKGKAAVFAVEVKGISLKELPELNDEFAQDVSEFETLDEYKASIVAKLTEAAEANAKQVKGDKLLEQAVANAQMDVPECMYESKKDQMMRDFENNISRQGLSVDVYCQYLGTTPEALKEQFAEPAKNNVDARLVLEQVAVEEGLTTTTEEENDEIKKIAESYGIEADKMIEACSDEDRKAISKDLLVQKALKLIEETAVEVEKKAE